MERYLLIESRDPFDCAEVSNDFQLAVDLARAGNDTTLLFIQNGVLPLRGPAHREELRRLHDNGVKLLCDDFSLAERGMQDAHLAGGVLVTGIQTVVAQLASRARVIWL